MSSESFLGRLWNLGHKVSSKRRASDPMGSPKRSRKGLSDNEGVDSAHSGPNLMPFRTQSSSGSQSGKKNRFDPSERRASVASEDSNEVQVQLQGDVGPRPRTPKSPPADLGGHPHPATTTGTGSKSDETSSNLAMTQLESKPKKDTAEETTSTKESTVSLPGQLAQQAVEPPNSSLVGLPLAEVGRASGVVYRNPREFASTAFSYMKTLEDQTSESIESE